MIDSTALYRRCCLTSIHIPVRMLLMVFLIILFPIIIACKFYNICAFPCIFPWHEIRTDRNLCMKIRIILSCLLGKHFRNLLTTLTCMSIINFISNTPEKKTCMVSVTPYPASDIFLPPLREETGIVVLCLWALPHIKCLIYHE